MVPDTVLNPADYYPYAMAHLLAAARPTLNPLTCLTCGNLIKRKESSGDAKFFFKPKCGR